MPQNTVIHLHAALPAQDEPPEWVQLVPPGRFHGADGRGPYTADAAFIVGNSREHLPAVLDEMHATDIGLRTGQAAPARGWIVELQDRGAGEDGGVWGRIEWTPPGAELMRNRAYRGISPAIAVTKQSGRVLAVLRASLTNVPNLPIKPILNSAQGNPMDMMDYLRQLLGLEPDADDALVRTTLQAMLGDRAMQGRLREPLGLAASATAAEVVTALQSRLAGAGESQQQVSQLQARVAELEAAGRRARAEAAVDAAITAGHAAVNAQRDRFITLHMQDPTGTEELMAAMPNINAGGMPPGGGTPSGAPQLTETDRQVIELMNLDEKAYLAQKAKGTGPVEIVSGRDGEAD